MRTSVKRTNTTCPQKARGPREKYGVDSGRHPNTSSKTSPRSWEIVHIDEQGLV
jgi:hypothetical protein